jgi:hypothetical protein
MTTLTSREPTRRVAAHEVATNPVRPESGLSDHGQPERWLSLRLPMSLSSSLDSPP